MRIVRLIVAGGMILSVQSAFATTAATSFQVTATVTAYCTVSAGALGFGSYSSAAAAAATSAINVTCSRSAPYTIALDQGAGTGASTSARLMTLSGGSDTVGYGLYKDSAHSQNWGNTSGTDTQAGTGNGSAQSYTVYGQISSGQQSAAGSYSDTINVTVTY